MNKQNKIIGENFVLNKLKEFGYKRINIRTSAVRTERIKKRKYKRNYWSFRNEKGRFKDFDFYVLVCLNEKRQIEKTFIVPSKIIGRRDIITIPKESKREFELKEYENKWEL